jgi:beta-galactosidase
VNWAQWNPAPLPGMVRLWSWEAFAHGAGCVSYFRWRQAPFAQEQMHAGLNTPDNRLDVGGNEAGQVAAEIRTVLAADAQANAAIRAKVALVYDYEAKWLFEIHPQGADFHYPRFAFEYYSALRSLGLDVDVVPVDAPLDGYRLIVVPPLPVVPADFAARLARSGAHVVFGPRTGSKTEDLQIPVNLPPGALAPVLPLRVWRVESMRPNVSEPVRLADSSASGAEDGVARHWRDFIESDGAAAFDVRARFADGHPAYVQSGAFHYLASLFDDALTVRLFERIANEAGLETMALGESVRISRRGALTYVFNYGEQVHTLADLADERIVIGSRAIEPQGVAVYRTT